MTLSSERRSDARQTNFITAKKRMVGRTIKYDTAHLPRIPSGAFGLDDARRRGAAVHGPDLYAPNGVQRVGSVYLSPVLVKSLLMSGQPSKRILNPFQRLWQSVMTQIIQGVPEETAICEFDCRKPECTVEEAETCERRWTKAAGELMPRTK
jgi:hypothetical protein